MIDQLIRLNSSRVGHDKIVRTIQYACKLVSAFDHYSESSQKLESTLRSSRKLLRMGTSIDALYSSCSVVNHPDVILRLTLTISRIASAMFLFGDHLIWLNNNSLIRINPRKWSAFSNKSWLYSIILNLIRDWYELRIAISYARKNGLSIPAFVKSYKNLVVDLLRNATDLILPLGALGNSS